MIPIADEPVKTEDIRTDFRARNKELPESTPAVKKALFAQTVPCIRTHKVARALSKIGVQVDLTYLDAHPSQVYKGLALPYRKITRLRDPGEAIKAINESDYDVIYSSNEPDYLTVLLTATNKPVVHDCHDMMSLRADISNEQMVLEYIANVKSDGNIYVNSSIRDIAVKRFGLVDKPILCLHSYVEKEQLPEIHYNKLSSSDKGIHCVYEGGLSNVKGHHRYLEELFLNLAAEKIHVHLYSPGNPEYFKSLENKSPYIHWEGVREPEALITEMTKYDFGLATFSLSDRNKTFLNTAFPNKIWDYLAAGLPILFSDLISFRKFAEESGVGIVIDPAANLRALAEKTTQIKIEKDFLAKKKWLMNDVAENIMEFFARVIQRRNSLDRNGIYAQKSALSTPENMSDSMANNKCNDVEIETRNNPETPSKQTTPGEPLDGKEAQEIFELIKKYLNERKYKEVFAVCDYWLKNLGANAAVHYFLGVALNGLGDFAAAIEHHRKALNLDPALADIARGQFRYKGVYDESNVPCIGCSCPDNDIVWVGNQSQFYSNNGLINPLRIWTKCKNCGLVYANPQPSEESYNKLCSAIALNQFSANDKNSPDNQFNWLVDIANNRLRNIERHLGRKGTLLDVGAGMGIFVGTAHDRGWDSVGLELTPEDCLYAKENYGLNLIQKNFYDFHDNETFDVVSLFAVIEHLRTPLKDLQRINRLVNAEGLFVLSTPNLSSLYSRKSKENNRFWFMAAHLSFFSREVLEKYLTQAGFEVIEENVSQEGMGRMELYCRKNKNL
jgi:2-polyprenyl-3-methyl-5-hydroxy-6-metoxy-1,4-benzoquinol methylase